ncbi:unnamed protein product [Leptosia nina]|uniref:FP protein C-terminal domain-containing protein n=1 Tax=Leptosia nina TaxID=320188 RepID=A0AAV1K2H0_9NEOP
MLTCDHCGVEFLDGVQCPLCQNHLDFACAGITEVGWRRQGAKQSSWKCPKCKSGSPRPPNTPTNTGLEDIFAELKRLTTQTGVIPDLMNMMVNVQAELAEIKSLKEELVTVKSSVEFTHQSIENIETKVSSLSKDVESLKKTRAEVTSLREQLDKLDLLHRDNEQRLRKTNIEIKGVPTSDSENLFTIMAKLGDIIKIPIQKDQINYIVRVPMRSDPRKKNIICSIHNLYLKENFIAAAKKHTIKSSDLGLQEDSRVFVNDHLTIENKILLNKTKLIAKQRGFAFVWVKNCKILIRRNPTSPALTIKSEKDLQKLVPETHQS